MSTQRPDVVVIGAGIVGAACAHELAAQGLNVLVIERAGVGGGVTAAGMGHIVVMDDTPAEFALSGWSRTLWHELAQQLDARHAFVRCGTVWVAADEEEYALAQTRQRALHDAGVACSTLDAQQLREAEPGLRADLVGGMIVHDDAVAYAPTVSTWLLTQPSRGRVTCRTNTLVTHVDRRGVHLASGEIVATGAVLIANGLQAVDLLPRVPLQAKKGHLLITDRYPGTIRHQILELGYIKSAHNASGTSVAFNVQPRPTGQLLIGSSRQFDSTDPAIEPAILARMLQRAAHFLPQLPALNAVRAWTGFRPASSDGMPLIGPAGPFAEADSHPSLWLATGHEGLGVTTALGTAKLIAAQLLGHAAAIDPTPYLPTRFVAEGTVHA
ncbi:FAD-dependent oxidoreductase [Paraburkholderia acidisoli]|uniref:FAD-dependent oxidoreductase n=1 Tax=Paraburkholderia acidisoli TaxID=2571748 RepID=A0A7Z2JIM8_9BURK|nr:FAD-dependent oxidoreductase [Paraburkholderia acidisoli]